MNQERVFQVLDRPARFREGGHRRGFASNQYVFKVAIDASKAGS